MQNYMMFFKGQEFDIKQKRRICIYKEIKKPAKEKVSTLSCHLLCFKKAAKQEFCNNLANIKNKTSKLCFWVWYLLEKPDYLCELEIPGGKHFSLQDPAADKWSNTRHKVMDTFGTLYSN